MLILSWPWKEARCMRLSISSSSVIIVDWPWKHRLCLWEWSNKKLSGSETYGRWREQKAKGRRRGRAKQSHEGIIKLFLSVGFLIVNYNIHVQWNSIFLPPHSNGGLMATLFWPKQKLSQLFFLKNPFNIATLLIMVRFLWPVDDQINGVPSALL